MSDETGTFNPASCNYYKTTDWDKIKKVLSYISEKRKDIEVVAIDTITYAMLAEFMQKAKVTGYGKFTEMGQNVYDLLKMIDGLRENLTVVVFSHTDYEDVNGTKQSDFSVPGGKLVKDVVKPVGMFTIVLETTVEKVGEDYKYYFMTQNNTTNMAKSPAGMFKQDRIDNDMSFVLDTIKKYEFGEAGV